MGQHLKDAIERCNVTMCCSGRKTTGFLLKKVEKYSPTSQARAFGLSSNTDQVTPWKPFAPFKVSRHLLCVESLASSSLVIAFLRSNTVISVIVIFVYTSA